MPKNLTQFAQPTQLLVADKPLSQGGVPVPLDFAAIKAKFGFEYCENIVTHNNAIMPDGVGDDVEKKERCDFIKAQLATMPQQSLVVCFISKEVGYGVFTRSNIRAGAIIGIYSGCKENNGIDQKKYTMSILGTGYRIDAQAIGGVTRFIQHMPFSLDNLTENIQAADSTELFGMMDTQQYLITEEIKKQLSPPQILAHARRTFIAELKKDKDIIAFNQEYQDKSFLQRPNVAQQIAFANVRTYSIQINGEMVLVFQAMRNVAANEQLGITYGHDYWICKRMIPCYFDRQGNVLPKEAYLPRLTDLCQKYKYSRETYLPDLNVAFRRACLTVGNHEDVLSLLEYGADLNGQDPQTGRSGLHMASINENPHTVLLLRSRGINESLTDADGLLAVNYDNFCTKIPVDSHSCTSVI